MTEEKLEYTNSILSFLLTGMAMAGLFYLDANEIIHHNHVSWWFNLGFLIPFGAFLTSVFFVTNINHLYEKLFSKKIENYGNQSNSNFEGAAGYSALYKSGCFILSIITFFLIKLCLSLALHTGLFSVGFFIWSVLSLGLFMTYIILMVDFFLDKEIVYSFFKK